MEGVRFLQLQHEGLVRAAEHLVTKPIRVAEPRWQLDQPFEGGAWDGPIPVSRAIYTQYTLNLDSIYTQS